LGQHRSQSPARLTEGFHSGATPKPTFKTEGFTETERIHAYKQANIDCNGYFALFNAEKPLINSTFNIARLILKCDVRNVASNISHSLKAAAEAPHRIKEYERIL
jgi:hypothetical protein